jgi:hypothetical protein
VELVIALAELIEAEGRALRLSAARLSWGVALIVVATLFAVAGAGLCLWSLHQFVLALAGPGTASLVTGLVTLLIAGLTGWAALRVSR